MFRLALRNSHLEVVCASCQAHSASNAQAQSGAWGEQAGWAPLPGVGHRLECPR